MCTDTTTTAGPRQNNMHELRHVYSHPVARKCQHMYAYRTNHQLYIIRIWHTHTHTQVNTYTHATLTNVEMSSYIHVHAHTCKCVCRFCASIYKRVIELQFCWATKKGISIQFFVICHHRCTIRVERILFKWYLNHFYVVCIMVMHNYIAIVYTTVSLPYYCNIYIICLYNWIESWIL